MKNAIRILLFSFGIISANLSALESLVGFDQKADYENKYKLDGENYVEPEYPFANGATKIGYSSIKSDIDENTVKLTGAESLRSYIKEVEKSADLEKQENLKKSLKLSNLIFKEKQMSDKLDMLLTALALSELEDTKQKQALVLWKQLVKNY